MGKNIVTGRGIGQGISDIMNFTDLHNYDVFASDLKKFAEKALEAAKTQPNGLQPSAEIQDSIWDSFCEKLGIDQYDIDEDETLYQIVCDFVEVVTKDFEKQNESVQKENSMNLLEAKKVMRDAGYKLMKEEWTYTPEIEKKLVDAGAAKYPDEELADEYDMTGEVPPDPSWDDDGFATDFRKVTKFVRSVVKEDLVYDCLQACKRCMSAQEVRDTLIKAAEQYVKTRKRPNQEDFTALMLDHFKKQRI